MDRIIYALLRRFVKLLKLYIVEFFKKIIILCVSMYTHTYANSSSIPSFKKMIDHLLVLSLVIWSTIPMDIHQHPGRGERKKNQKRKKKR